MNKENIAKVIKAIESNGQLRFNMSAFIGRIIGYGSAYGIRERDSYREETDAIQIRDLTTDLFNCNSVGCIAGFATAVANDWKNPFVNLSEEDQKKHAAYHFEKEANEFLGLTEREGKNLYYGDDFSVWKFLLYTGHDDFVDLELEDDLEYQGDEYWADEEYSIRLNTIKPEHAVKLLKMLIDDKIILDDGQKSPIYLNDLAVLNSVL
jgi:hypothetical protein